MEGEEEKVVTVTVGEQSPTEGGAATEIASAVADATVAEAAAQTAVAAAETAVTLAAGVAAAAEQQAAQTIGEAYARIAALEERGNQLWQTMESLQSRLTSMDGLLQTLMPSQEQPSKSQAEPETTMEVIEPVAVESPDQPEAVAEKPRRTRVI